MANVDFTLEDIGKQTGQITTRIVEQALVKEREITRIMIRETIEEIVPPMVERIVETIMVREFTSLWDHNLRPMLDELHNDVRELERRTALS